MVAGDDGVAFGVLDVGLDYLDGVELLLLKGGEVGDGERAEGEGDCGKENRGVGDGGDGDVKGVR